MHQVNIFSTEYAMIEMHRVMASCYIGLKLSFPLNMQSDMVYGTGSEFSFVQNNIIAFSCSPRSRLSSITTLFYDQLVLLWHIPE